MIHHCLYLKHLDTIKHYFNSSIVRRVFSSIVIIFRAIIQCLCTLCTYTLLNVITTVFVVFEIPTLKSFYASFKVSTAQKCNFSCLWHALWYFVYDILCSNLVRFYFSSIILKSRTYSSSKSAFYTRSASNETEDAILYSYLSVWILSFILILKLLKKMKPLQYVTSVERFIWYN